MKTIILYDSITGNTEILGETIASMFSPKEVLYCGQIRDCSITNLPEVDLYFIGSWTNRGDLVLGIQNVLQTLHHKKIVLFGTCGFGGSSEYFETLKNRFKHWIPEDNEYLGCFLCQGKMPVSVKERYVKMIKDHPDDQKLQVSLKNFEEALTHPDDQDLKQLKEFIRGICTEDSHDRKE